MGASENLGFVGEGGLGLPDEPSLAVLPLLDLSGDAEAQAFADGVTEHLTYAFACTPGLFVSGRSSAFTFRGRRVDPQQVGRALGIAHALEGTLNRDGGRLVMEARLSGTHGEGQLWAQSFVGPEEALFDHMAVLIEQTVHTIAPESPVDPSDVQLRTRFPGDFDIYAKFLAAYTDHIPRTAEAAHLLLASLDDLVRIMPNEPLPLALSAQSIVNCLLQGWSTDPEHDRVRGLEHARAALEKPAAQNSAAVLMMAAYPLAFLGHEYERALALMGRSLTLNPNSAATHERSGWVRLYVGEPDRAIEHFRRAKRLSPLDTTTYRFDAGLGFGYCLSGQHELAVTWLRRAVEAMPSYTTSYRALAASLAHLGRRTEAERAAATLMRLEPGYRVGQTVQTYPPSPALTLYVEGMRLAGLPE